jgi:hypothetical protein
MVILLPLVICIPSLNLPLCYAPWRHFKTCVVIQDSYDQQMWLGNSVYNYFTLFWFVVNIYNFTLFWLVIMLREKVQALSTQML